MGTANLLNTTDPSTTGMASVLDEIPPRYVVGLGLLAIPLTVWYSIGRPSTAGYVAALNVAIIVLTLFVAMRPTGHEHGSAGSTATENV